MRRGQEQDWQINMLQLHLNVKKKISFKNKKTLKQFVGLFQESEKYSHASVSSRHHSYSNDTATKIRQFEASFLSKAKTG